MRKYGMIGTLAVLAIGVAVAIAARGILPDGLGALDDVDWPGIHGIGA